MTEETKPTTETEALADVLRTSLPSPELLDISDGQGGKIQMLALPDGQSKFTLKSIKDELDKYAGERAPKRRHGTAVLDDLPSFVEHVNRFKSPASALFVRVDGAKPSLGCVFDYYPAGADVQQTAWCGHRACYAFPLSDEWKAWQKASGEIMGQAVFAAFLEDRIGDVVDPATAFESTRDDALQLGVTLATPSQIRSLADGLDVRVDARVCERRKLQSGESQLVFDVAHKDASTGAPLTVPSAFLLALSIFRNGAAYQVIVRLRYAIDGGALKWRVLPYQPERKLDHAFREAANVARDQTELPLFFGSPE